jgi:oligosaccharide repeat unit polymerase
MSHFSVAVNCILGVLLLREYYVSVLRRHRIIDLWSIVTFSTIVIPIVLVGPFADSPANVFAIGDAAYDIPRVINSAYAICFAGILSWYLGSLAFRHLKAPVRQRSIRGISRLVSSITPAFNPTSVWCLFAVTLVSGVLINLVYGAGDKSLRDVMLENASARPLFNLFIISLAPLTFLLLVANYLQTRKMAYLVAGGAVSVICLFSGARSVFFLPLLWIYIGYKAKNPKGSLFLLVLIGVAMVAIGLLVSALRSGGELEDLSYVLGYGVLYGNTFSDFRDFCWYLTTASADVTYAGATYFAGLMSFVPTYLSQFREEFNIGVVTATAIGMSPQEHAGIRLSAFGEMYINFGSVGVCIGSFLVSYAMKCFDQVMFKDARTEGYVHLVTCIQLSQIPLVFFSSNTVSTLYSFASVVIVLMWARWLFGPRRTHPNALRTAVP